MATGVKASRSCSNPARWKSGCPPLLRNAAARVTLRRHGAVLETVDTMPRASWAFRRQAEAFVSGIKSGDAPLADGQDSVQDLVLAEAIWRRHLER